MEEQQKDDDTNSSLPRPSIHSIKKKLSAVGLTDVERTCGQVEPVEKRRSRSYGDIFDGDKDFCVPSSVLTQKKSLRNLPAAFGANRNGDVRPLGLEELKKNLINEIKTKLVEQIELKKTHRMEIEEILHSPSEVEKEEPTLLEISVNQSQGEQQPQQEAIECSQKLIDEERKFYDSFTVNSLRQVTKCTNDKVEASEVSVEREPEKVTKPTSLIETARPAADPIPEENKRFSICSTTGVEIRKHYSPVYERTRKLVRVSHNGINRWSSSQPQVQSQKQEHRQQAEILAEITSKEDLKRNREKEQEKEKSPSPNSVQTVSVDVNPKKQDQSTEFSTPVSSLQSLTSSRMEAGTRNTPLTPNNTTDGEFFPSQSCVKVNASYPRISKSNPSYSAHPSVYVIERDAADIPYDVRSEKSSRITTIKRNASFKGIKRNLKKTFSSQLTVLTLEKVEKAPETNIPMIVVCCIETLQIKNLLKTEGLYRSSPSQMEVRKVIKYARKGQYDYVKDVDDPVILAGTLKSFFFTLKTHIISQELMEKSFPKRCLADNLSETELIDRLKVLISDLDTTHYDTLEYLIKHLQEVAAYNKFNLMTPQNLGVVWAPCLFTNCDKTLEGADLLSLMGQQTRLMELLITNCDVIFDRYTIDEITIAIEDGYSAESIEDEPIDLRPNYEINGNEIVKRKLLRNLSITLDNRLNGGGINNHKNGTNYELQTSSTVPVVGAEGSGKRLLQKNAVKRQRNRSICVLS